MEFTAVIIGATGLVGNHLVKLLINDEDCKELILITRRKTNFNHSKIVETIIDFSNKNDYLKHIKGDVLFSCLGTTRFQANSIENHYLVDYTYQFTAAKAAERNSVAQYILVSSPWSNIKSNNYYRKMKAELERDASNLSFEKVILIKPNGLIGKRKKIRFGERWLIPLFIGLTKIIPSLRKHQPIEAKQVAKAMLNSFYKKNQIKVMSYSRNDVLELSNLNTKIYV